MAATKQLPTPSHRSNRLEESARFGRFEGFAEIFRLRTRDAVHQTEFDLVVLYSTKQSTEWVATHNRTNVRSQHNTIRRVVRRLFEANRSVAGAGGEW